MAAINVGSLRPGKRADLAIVELADGGCDDPYELLLNSSADVVQTYRAGE